MTVQVQLLGPVTARVDGAPVDLGGPLPRGLVAVLALEAPAAVPPERLVAAVWGDTAPAGARQSMRSYLSRLRGVLGAACLERVAGGHRLRVDELDVTAFAGLAEEGRALLGAGDATGAVGRLTSALACWEGRALADVGHLPFAASVVARLEEQRLLVEEDLLEARLAAGGHAAALDDLHRLLAGHPLRERLAGLLMLALHRAGRQAEALGVYTDLRMRLGSEAGLEPGAAVAELHRRMLAQDPALQDPGAPAIPEVPRPAAAPIPPPAASTAAVTATAAGTTPSAAVTAPAAPASAVPARSRVPAPLSSFIGRTDELAAATILCDTGRLVTLTGMGGSGKTRLALELARRSAVREEVRVAELAPLEDGAALPGVVAEALDIPLLTGQAGTAALADAIGDRSLLLLVDSCEHLVEDVAVLVEHLLQRCRGLRVLATSREPLGVAGERIMVVPSLLVGDRGAPGDAMLLFADRAAQVDPRFVLDDATAPVVQRICAELDGIPLAIELAAARLAVLSPAQLADLLDDRFAVLTSGSRTAQPRHRTLEATVAWSYELLGADERELFAAASVFRGGFDHDALAAVAGREGTLDVLGRLVAKSMLVVERAGEARRYRMLVTLREYARRQLDDDRRRVLADAHARWAADLLAAAHEHLRTPAALPWWQRLVAEHHNLRAALQHALETDQAVLALRIAGHLGFFWYRHGPVAEGLGWLDAALRLGADAPPHERAPAHLTAAMLSFFVADRDAIVRHLREATAATDDRVDPGVAILALIYRAIDAAWFGDPAVAESLLDRAEARLGTAPAWAGPEVILARAQVAKRFGDLAAAERLELRAREAALAVGHAWCAGQAGRLAAMERLAQGRPGEAAGLLVEVVREFAAQEDRISLLSSLYTMAAVLAALGDSTAGAELVGAVEAIGERIGFAPTRFDLFEKGFREAVASRLSPEAFAAALTRGRGLDLGAAVALSVSAARGAGAAA